MQICDTKFFKNWQMSFGSNGGQQQVLSSLRDVEAALLPLDWLLNPSRTEKSLFLFRSPTVPDLVPGPGRVFSDYLSNLLSTWYVNIDCHREAEYSVLVRTYILFLGYILLKYWHFIHTASSSSHNQFCQDPEVLAHL